MPNPCHNMKKTTFFSALVFLACIAGAQEQNGNGATATPRQLEARAARMIANAEELLAGGDTVRGVGMLESVFRMFPETQARFKAYLALGRHRLGAAQYDEALATLRFADAAESEDVRAESMMLQAKAHRELKRPGEAAALLRRVTQDFPASPFANDAHFEIGQIHFEGGRWTRAAEAFAKVGTAVPSDTGKAGAVLAEAGQRLFVHVADRDLPVLAQLGETTVVRATAKSGDTETMTVAAYGDRGIDGLAFIDTVSEPTQHNDGKLTVQGGDEVTVEYIDKTNSEGGVNVPVFAHVRMVSSGVLSFMDGAYKQRVQGVFAGQPAFLRLRDLDLDTTAGRDTIKLSVTATYVKPRPTSEELALGAEDPGEDTIVERGAIDVTLTETAEHSGVFEGRFMTQLAATNAPAPPAGTLVVEAGDKLSVAYLDARHLGGLDPATRTAAVTVLVGGSTEPQSIVAVSSDPDVQSRKLLLEAQLLQKWGGIFKDVGLDTHAKAKSDEGLANVAEIMDMASRYNLPRDIIEQTFVVKWELELLRDDLNAAIRTCNALVRRYPDTVYADLALMRVAEARTASNEPRDIESGIGIYRSVLSLPNSSNKAAAQFGIALAYEKLAAVAPPWHRESAATAALRAFRACSERYPDSSYAGESFKRIVNYHVSTRDYARALETLDRVFTDYPDAPWLDEMLLQWGIVLYRRGDRAGAAEKFSRVLEEYPGGKASTTATELLKRVKPN